MVVRVFAFLILCVYVSVCVSAGVPVQTHVEASEQS